MRIGCLVSIVCFSASIAGASVADSLYSLAQKLYSQGAFAEAAKAYGNVCPQLEAKEKRICMFKEIKALAENKKTDAAQAAEAKVLQLLSQTEPSDSLFAEINAEAARLQVMLKQAAMAVRSWNAAQASANSGFFPELFVLCQDIVSAFPESGLTTQSCDKVKPSDASLTQLPRNKNAPLSQASNTANHQSLASNPQSLKWYVQLGAFSSRENAEKLVADFKQRGVQLHIAEVITDKKLFAVRTGTFGSTEEAKKFAEQKIEPSHKDYRVLQ
jgi:cell division septation protein DedD